MNKMKTALKTQKFQTFKTEEIASSPSSVNIVDAKSSDTTETYSVSQGGLKKSTATTRFRDVNLKLRSKNKKEKGRQTVVFLTGSSQKKNLAYYDKDIYETLKKRKQAQVNHNKRDATPINLTESDLVDIEEFFSDDEKKKRSESLWDALIEKVWKPKAPRFSVYTDTSVLFDVADLDEISKETVDVDELFDDFEMKKSSINIEDLKEEKKLKKPKEISKVQLKESETFDIMEIQSLTVAKGTQEANELEKFNLRYNFITSGAGRLRTSEAEAQTENPRLKTRSVNTESAQKTEKETFVSNYEIYDTYQELEQKKKLLKLSGDEEKTIELTSYGEIENFDEALIKNENFQVASMILERLLAENVLRTKQKRMFNIPLPNPLDSQSLISYRISSLFTYKCFETMGKEVVDMSFCPSDSGDLIAIAYGIYKFRESKHRISGAVLIWNAKNPVNPERRFVYNLPVTAVEFSPNIPQYLAVALYDGTVEILDITPTNGKTVIARSERKTSPSLEAIWAIKWIQEKNLDMILTASQDGRVTKFKMGSGPNLIGFPQVHLDRVDGTVEALPIKHKSDFLLCNPHPQALCLQTHPVNGDLYFVGTDEGCVHICSTNFPYQHIGVLQLHNGGVFSIDYSPFSPKIFLTAGSDWIVRVWIEEILEPIIELSNGFGAVHCAYWSPINPTIIASCTQESVRVWDLLRKTPKPVIVKNFNTQLTVFKFSLCGRSLLVGDNEGTTHVVALEDFPFPPKFKYDQLEKVIGEMLVHKPLLKEQVTDLGYLGYPLEKKSEKKD